MNGWVLIALVLVGLLVVLPSLPVSSPVRISYVYSDSMEPTIDTNDGYLLVPAGDINEGDVVTFRSEEHNEHLTHRVAGVNEQGYVTKGDNSPDTDQATGHSYVQKDDVVGEVFSFRGSVVTVPKLGVVLGAFEGNRGLSAGLGAGVVLLLLLFDTFGTGGSTGGSPTRSVVRNADVLRPVLLVGFVFVVASVWASTHTRTLDYVAVGHATEADNLLVVGESATRTVLFEGSAPPFTHRAVSADGMSVAETGMNETAVDLTVEIPPPETAGEHTKTVSVHHYPASLPPSAVEWLHSISPVAAVVGTIAGVFAPAYAATRVFVDWKKPLRLVEKPVAQLLFGGE